MDLSLSIFALIGLLTGVIAAVVAFLVFQRERGSRKKDQQAQDAAWQRFYDKMIALLNQGLVNAEVGSVISLDARASTLQILLVSDSNRKRRVVEFLYDMNLITGDQPKISLAKAALNESDLSSATLDNVNLGGAFLNGAKLSRTSLKNANLEEAALTKANLNRAILSGANLKGADLRSANLSGINATQAQFSRSTLGSAEFSGADLRDADFSGAFMAGAVGLTNEALERAGSLKGAILPDGSEKP